MHNNIQKCVVNLRGFAIMYMWQYFGKRKSNCEGLLKCYRNVLVPGNPNIPDNDVRGLLLCRLRCGNGRHWDSCLTNENTKWI